MFPFPFPFSERPTIGASLKERLEFITLEGSGGGGIAIPSETSPGKMGRGVVGLDRLFEIYTGSGQPDKATMYGAGARMGTEDEDAMEVGEDITGEDCIGNEVGGGDV